MKDKILEALNRCRQVAKELTWIDFVLALPTIFALSWAFYKHFR